jgi:hypothetical protein
MAHTTTHGAAQVTRDGRPVSPLLASADEAFGWLLGHQPMSTDWAIRYEGYGVEPVPAEPWTDKEAARLRGMAVAAFEHDGPLDVFRDDDDEALTRDNCGGCVLRGWGEYVDGGVMQPNYANWARTYVEAGHRIPARWRTGFHAVLNAEDNPGHRVALLRSLATWGVRFTD